MMKYILMFTTALTLSACSSDSLFESWNEDPETLLLAPKGSVYKIEKPYEINGVWHFPAENYSYQEEGLATWYVPADGKGAITANGEEYIATEMTARHKTLPLPSIVKITNLENGKSIIARVNDRGPMVNNRLVDVSQKAAQELGFPPVGTTKVRVEILPRESQDVRDALLAAGRVYTEDSARQDLTIVPPMPLPAEDVVSQEIIPPQEIIEPVYQPQQQYKPAPVGTIYIRMGAFGNPENVTKAIRSAQTVATVSTTEKLSSGRVLTVVEAGPFASQTDAERALKQLKRLGYSDAYITK